MLSNTHRAALASLRSLWPDARIVVIGATALDLQRKLNRRTHDVDLVLAVDLAAFPGPLATHPQWKPTRHLQRWQHEGVLVDILPVGAHDLAMGRLAWPDGFEMSLEAFTLLDTAELICISEELNIMAAPVPLLMVLKMVSWLDRPAERERDLSDLVWLFAENYLDERDDNDFDRLHTSGAAVGEAHALLLGRDISAYPGAREIGQKFVHRLKNEYAYQYNKVRNCDSIEDDPAFAAFERGLGLDHATRPQEPTAAN